MKIAVTYDNGNVFQQFGSKLPNLLLLTQQVRQERGKDENSSDI